MPDYNQIFDEIGGQIKQLAENTVSKYRDQAVADANALVASMKEDLIRWTDLLANKRIDTKEFEILVNSEKDLVQMKALQTSGLAAIRVQQFSMSVLNMVVDVVFTKVLPAAVAVA
ncbi:hypothetical protein QTN47_11610 [Danxiaibacter flavus]|uniref:Uncharacterized protein n=1 Tax=Danxiaibacter flavus TaxID=3049108 RepID=A0ABV3ZE44_9BACT|nr:hypothetical protein QNM32_11615 [Chitinophagaceae bacterium DXS]